MANDKFGRSDCGEDEIRILSIFSMSKKSTGAGYFNYNAKRGNQAAKRYGKGVKSSKYLTQTLKKPLISSSMRLHKCLFFNTLI